MVQGKLWARSQNLHSFYRKYITYGSFLQIPHGFSFPCNIFIVCFLHGNYFHISRCKSSSVIFFIQFCTVFQVLALDVFSQYLQNKSHQSQILIYRAYKRLFIFINQVKRSHCQITYMQKSFVIFQPPGIYKEKASYDYHFLSIHLFPFL